MRSNMLGDGFLLKHCLGNKSFFSVANYMYLINHCFCNFGIWMPFLGHGNFYWRVHLNSSLFFDLQLKKLKQLLLPEIIKSLLLPEIIKSLQIR